MKGRIIGIRQVKVHKQAKREVASGFVLPQYRRQGISARLMDALLARETRPPYAIVNEKRAPNYEKFGFRRVSIDQLPAGGLNSILLRSHLHAAHRP